MNDELLEFGGDGGLAWFMAGKSGTVPIVGDSVFPAGEDSLRGDEGEAAGRVFGRGKEGVESLAFMGKEAVVDAVQFEVPAVILVFEPKECDFRDRGMA
jgi:hypothetical protein